MYKKSVSDSFDSLTIEKSLKLIIYWAIIYVIKFATRVNHQLTINGLLKIYKLLLKIYDPNGGCCIIIVLINEQNPCKKQPPKSPNSNEANFVERGRAILHLNSCRK